MIQRAMSMQAAEMVFMFGIPPESSLARSTPASCVLTSNLPVTGG